MIKKSLVTGWCFAILIVVLSATSHVAYADNFAADISDCADVFLTDKYGCPDPCVLCGQCYEGAVQHFDLCLHSVALPEYDFCTSAIEAASTCDNLFALYGSDPDFNAWLACRLASRIDECR